MLSVQHSLIMQRSVAHPLKTQSINRAASSTWCEDRCMHVPACAEHVTYLITVICEGARSTGTFLYGP